MEKFPFTATGFSQLQVQLYALTDPQLLIESELIKNDFEHWMENHFILSVSQMTFLVAMDSRAKSFLAFETSFAVGNRLPVVLEKTDPPSGDDEQGKIIRPKSTITTLWGPNAAYQASGTLTIQIDYQN